MKITTLSGLLLAVTAQVVSAEPAKHETAERVSYTSTQAKPRPPAGEWVELATPTPAAHGREYITVDGRYALIRIAATRGRPIVRAVRIDFRDGKHRFVRVDRVLERAKTETIDLKGAHDIVRIVVDTDWQSRGLYAVHGARPQPADVATR